jgi:leucyl-tRNA synthetase
MLDERANYWLPVDQYIGGIEHAILHLLYARFFHKLMRDEKLIDSDEPFTNLLTQGMVLAETFSREGDGGKKVYYSPDEVETERDTQGKISGAHLKADGQAVDIGRMESMSKSKKNGVDPQAMIDKYGADTVRLFMMFAAPPEHTLEWNDDAVAGAHRFLRRVWQFVCNHHQRLKSVAPLFANGGFDFERAPADVRELRTKTHTALERINRDYERFQFNTVVAACMELTNALYEFEIGDAVQNTVEDDRGAAVYETMSIVLKILGPIVPHIGHVLWQEIGGKQAMIDAPWPQVDNRALVRDTVTYVVQVKGKLRGHVDVPADSEQDAVLATALEDPGVMRHVGDPDAIRKVVFVPGRLINIVV